MLPTATPSALVAVPHTLMLNLDAQQSHLGSLENNSDAWILSIHLTLTEWIWSVALALRFFTSPNDPRMQQHLSRSVILKLYGAYE